MSAKKTAGKVAKFTATSILMLGVITSIGLLAYCGMLAIVPSIALGWVAFALAGFVDGEVYKQNISKGIDDLKLLGKKGLDILIIKSLDKKLANKSEALSGFAKEYYELKEYAESFTHKKLNHEQKEEKKKAIKRLQRMQKYFVTRVFSPANDALDDDLIKSLRNELPSFKRKIWFLRASIPISLGAGISFGFATAASLDLACVGLGVGLTAALSAAIWPLAIIACIGYAFLIYHTIADIISNETITKWRKKVVGWFKKDENETRLKHGLRVAGITCLLIVTIGLGVIATLATAGTWWIAVKNGAQLLPALVRAGEYIRDVLVPLATITNLVFTIRNSLESVKNIIKTVKNSHPIELLKAKKEKLFKEETTLQIINPFRIIAKTISLPFMFVVFVGHLISVGLTGDRAPGLSQEGTIACAVIGAASDGLVDFHYVNENDSKPHKNHDHDHGLILDWVLKVVLSPLLLLSAVWDFAVTKPHDDSKQAFAASLKKSFGIKNHPEYIEHICKPPTSNQWIKQEIEMRIIKHEKRAETPNEKEALVALKNHMIFKIDNPAYLIPATDFGNISNKHRLFNSHNGGIKFADKIIKEYFPTQRSSKVG
jgi:hypothetical protein